MKLWFEESIAEFVGVEAAVLYEHLNFWCKKNYESASKKHFKKGFYWTYHTQKDLSDYFSFWNLKKIGRLKEKLEKADLIITDRFNKFGFDKTTWYTTKILSDGTTKDSDSENTISSHLRDGTDLPIPDVTPNIFTDNNYWNDEQFIDQLRLYSDQYKFISHPESSELLRLACWYHFHQLKDPCLELHHERLKEAPNPFSVLNLRGAQVLFLLHTKEHESIEDIQSTLKAIRADKSSQGWEGWRVYIPTLHYLRRKNKEEIMLYKSAKARANRPRISKAFSYDDMNTYVQKNGGKASEQFRIDEKTKLWYKK